MKSITIFFTLFVLMFSFNSSAQRGKDGNLNVTGSNTVLNTYTHLTATPAAGSTSITVSNNSMNGGAFTSNLAAGDLIMIIQMQGASVDINNWPVISGGNHTAPAANLYDWWLAMEDFGAITNYNLSGYFQTVEVAGVTGVNTIELQCGVDYAYNHNKHVQVVRIPRFDDLTVSGGANSIVPDAWDGQTGGIVALEVDGVFTINAGSSISASGFGFRGGQLDNVGQSGNPNNPNETRYPGTPDPAEGSEKGESIFGYYTEYDNVDSRYGIGATANGGGGGGYQNCGGGGGSNVQTSIAGFTGKGIPVGYATAWNQEAAGFATSSSPGGGRGGYALSESAQNPNTLGPNQTAWSGDARKNNGGFGGHPLAYDANRLFFGGGGGAGDQDSDQGGAGGTGGGIVYISSYGTFVGSGSITADGGDGEKSNPNNESTNFAAPKKGNDGAGGGGAGGAIYIESAAAIPSTLTLSAIGGNGGDQDISLASGQSPEAGGPGGAGSGGYITYTSGTPTELVTGGVNGTTNSAHLTAFPPNGATTAGPGISGLNSNYYDLTATDLVFCGTTTTDLSVTLLGALPAGSSIEWYTQEFGGTSVNSGATYAGVTISTTTTFYIGVCGAGDFRIPLMVTITGAPNLVVTDPAAVCAPATVDITAASVTTGSDAGTLTYWTDAAATNSFAGATTAGAGTYYIQLDVGGGCTTVEAVVVTVNPSEDATFSMSPTCDGGTATITGTTGGTFTFNIAPTDAAVIDATTGTITGGTPGTTYDILYTTGGACSDFSVESVTASLADDATFSMNPTCDGGTATVSGTTGGTFSFNSAPGDAAVIDGTTGAVTGGTSGSTYDILYTTSGACPETSVVSVTANLIDDASFTMSPTCDGGTATLSGTPGGTFTFNTAPSDAAVIDAATGTVSGGTPGNTYDVMYATTGACAASSTVSVTASLTDDASFTMSPTCDGGTATLTGTTGGTFTFNTAPIDAAVIDATTGTITGGTAGSTYDVLYATTGACAASSTQSVTALSSDDASFTTTATCDGGTVNITGTTGGTFTFNTAPSDAAVIDGATGAITGGTAGNSYDILYTTSGTCPASSVETVTAVAQDDASFTLTAACSGATANVTGLAGGTFTFNTAPTDAAVIDGVTGAITGGSSNVTYDVLYTTNGACPNTSVQSVTSLTTDDATFTMTSSCTGGTAAVSGTTGGTFTFNVAPSDAAVIDAVAGTVSNGTSGMSYDVLYTTSGACSASSVVSFTALSSDDATFSISPNCDGGTSLVSGTLGGTFTFSTPPTDAAAIDPSSGTVSTATSGASYDIVYTTNGACPSSSTQTLTVLTSDDATFTMSPTCDGGTAIVSGTTGGTFTFNVAPTDAAIIDASTGEITGGTSGTNYDVLYTTNGACPATLVVSVTANTIDDASFTLVPTCDGATAVINGTTGGTFTFNVPPTDAAVIDAATGEITGGSAGSTYDVNYATSGACAASSSESVTVLSGDDATFTVVPNCFGGTATIVGTAGGTFSFDVTPTDGAQINAVTGEVTNASSNATYNVVYTTNGACPDVSTVSLTVLTQEDASFILTPTCDGATATVLGDVGGVFDFDVPALAPAVIDPATGTISGGSFNSTYYVSYTTQGACSTSEVESVTVDDCTDETQIVVPTAFTPDNDGDNDNWEILELDNKYPNNTVKVYNRWGDLIFEHNSSVSQPYDSNRWDGTYRGNLMPVASYFFVIDFNDGVTEHMTGSVSIILKK